MTDPRPQDAIEREVVSAYREASRLTGEAPGVPAHSDARPAGDPRAEASATVRAAVLAAAAHAVREGHRSHVDAPVAQVEHGSTAKVSTLAIRRRTHWPMAAAATVIISSIAALLASHVDEYSAPEIALQEKVQDARQSEASANQAPAAPLSPEPDSSVGRSSAKLAPDTQGKLRTRSTTILPGPAPENAATAPAAPAASASAAWGSTATTSSPRALAKEASMPPPASPQTLPPPAAAAPDRAQRESAFEPAAAPAAPQISAKAAARAALPAPTSAPLADQNSTQSALERSEVIDESDPTRWTEHIRHLRQRGLDSEAEAQIARFKTRYPRIVLPADLLRPLPGSR